MAEARDDRVADLRRHKRTAVDVGLEFSVKGSDQRVEGRARDISIGGMFVETTSPAAFATEIVAYMSLPGHRGTLAIPGVVRWSRRDGMGVQFRLLGARETHAITVLTSSRQAP